MRFSTTFKSAAIIMAATAVSFAAPASAHDNGYQHRHQSNGDDQLLGGAIGAIAGGVLGSQLAGNGARTEGSVLGAVIGGVAGAAIASDGSSNRGYHSNGGYYQTQHRGGYYNPQTGYYNNGGYYQQPAQTYYNQGYAPQGYYNYPTRTYTTTTYRAPSYSYHRPAYNPYYRAPRTGISININTGNRGYRNRGYRNRGYSNRNLRHRNRGHQRHYRRRGH
ncbi:glycine zipper 2TM domain-containing protein [Litorimonas sp. WD9-15]|uniref:glycine zipper 2TM domain-containing protein n=1 Tax=Litorimonas sp. WD9-15 TaxID=3418716 RepID=UPI003D04C831